VAEEVNPDVVASQVDRLRVFLSQKFRNHSEVWQLMAPVEALTPVFLAEVTTAAGRHPIALFFDTYERTGTYLEGWLLDLLAGRRAANTRWTSTGGVSTWASALRCRWRCSPTPKPVSYWRIGG
jgi:hypothetical protein